MASGKQSVFYVSHNGEEQGPFDIQTIVDRIEANQLFDLDYMFVEEKEDWVAIGEYLVAEGINFKPADVTNNNLLESVPQAYGDTTPEESQQQSHENGIDTNAVMETEEEIKAKEEANLPDPSSMPTDESEELNHRQKINLADIAPPSDDQLEQGKVVLTQIEEQQTQASVETPDINEQYEQEFNDEDTHPSIQFEESARRAAPPEAPAPIAKEEEIDDASEVVAETTQVGSIEADSDVSESTQPEINLAALEKQEQKDLAEQVTAVGIPVEPVQQENQAEPEEEVAVHAQENKLEATETASENANSNSEEPEESTESNESIAVASTDNEMLSQEVDIKDGEASVEIDSNFAGKLELSLSGNDQVDLSDSKQVDVASGRASKIVLFGPSEIEAGKPITLNFLAHDDYGNIDIQFEGQIKLDSKDFFEIPGALALKSGVGSMSFTINEAGIKHIKILAVDHDLELPEAFDLEVFPGPAHQLVIDTPEELSAGETLKVKIRAVDQFGNPTKNFSGKVTLNIKGSLEPVLQKQA